MPTLRHGRRNAPRRRKAGSLVSAIQNRLARRDHRARRWRASLSAPVICDYLIFKAKTRGFAHERLRGAIDDYVEQITGDRTVLHTDFFWSGRDRHDGIEQRLLHSDTLWRRARCAYLRSRRIYFMCFVDCVYLCLDSSCNAAGSKRPYRNAGLMTHEEWLEVAHTRTKPTATSRRAGCPTGTHAFHRKITHTAKPISAAMPRAMRARKTLPIKRSWMPRGLERFLCRVHRSQL